MYCVQPRRHLDQSQQCLVRSIWTKLTTAALPFFLSILTTDMDPLNNGFEDLP
ncbi:unnamed protein product, partial [Nesidiocoris tenuis]